MKRPAHLGGASGYWMPVASLDPLPASAIGWPTRMCLGFRAVVDDPRAATSASRLEVVPRMAGYGPERLSRDRARRVRQALASFEFRVLTDPEPLLRSGFDVAAESAARSGQAVSRGGRHFVRETRLRFEADPQLVVGVFDGVALVAFALSYAIGSTVYFTDVCTTDDAMRRKASDGLYWMTLRAWSQVPGIERASLGMHLAERPGLLPYKATFGGVTASLPTVSRLRRPVAEFLRRRRPVSYGRLAGGAE